MAYLTEKEMNEFNATLTPAALERMDGPAMGVRYNPETKQLEPANGVVILDGQLVPADPQEEASDYGKDALVGSGKELTAKKDNTK